MAFRPPPFYPITDASESGAPHAVQVRLLAGAGARLVQIRDKAMEPRTLLREIDRAVKACREAGALLVVNDRVDLARLAGAGAVHLGEEDLPVPEARRILGPAAVIGSSSHDGRSARAAEASGADYVAIGPVFTTVTKGDAGPAVGLDAVREVRDAVKIPVVAIGGITLERAADVLAAGADSVAVIRGVAGGRERARAWVEGVQGPDEPPRGLIFLTGFMGSGKTSVGRVLARRLGRRFVDLDRCIEDRLGRTIPEIFDRDGEPAFRDAEERALDSIPAGGDAVVALGGGTLLRRRNRERIRRRGPLVWLECDPDVAVARCAAGSERPLLQTPADARALHEARLPGYRTADARVPASGPGVEDVSEQVLRRVVQPRIR